VEHTNTYGVYRLLFDETNTEQVDTLLVTIDQSLNALGDWDNAYAHFRYRSNKKVNICSIHPRGEQSDFWKKHFAGFVKTTIPTAIDTSHLHQPTKGRHKNRVKPSYRDISRGHGHTDNDSDVTSPTAAETATQQTRPRPVPSPGSQGSPTQQAGLASLKPVLLSSAMQKRYSKMSLLMQYIIVTFIKWRLSPQGSIRDIHISRRTMDYKHKNTKNGLTRKSSSAKLDDLHRSRSGS
jgi:hypothetical protein